MKQRTSSTCTLRGSGLTVLLALVTLGCGVHDFFGVPRRASFQREQLVGAWEADSGWLEALRASEYGDVVANAKPTLTLRANGTFEATDFPDKVFLPGIPPRHDGTYHLVSGSGSWKLSESGLRLNFDTPGSSLGLFVYRLRGKPVLRLYLGDPDLLDLIQYHKAKE